MRMLGLVGVLCLACSRANPAFDGTATDDGTQTVGPDTAGTVTLDTGDTGPIITGPGTADPDTLGTGTTSPDPDTTTASDTAGTDLPVEPVCALGPSPGASIRLGDPATFGGVCPTGMDIWTTVVSNNGAEIVLDTCTESCAQCLGSDHPLSVSPLVIGDHLPAETCLLLQARSFLQLAEERCHFGALTIHDPLLSSPYVIATTRSSNPTPAAVDLLAGAIADPVKALECDCDTVGQPTDCCHRADTPSFWVYTIDGMDVYPGEDAPIEVGDTGGLAHSFRLFQAEQIPTCEDQTLHLSWAVVASL